MIKEILFLTIPLMKLNKTSGLFCVDLGPSGAALLLFVFHCYCCFKSHINNVTF